MTAKNMKDIKNLSQIEYFTTTPIYRAVAIGIVGFAIYSYIYGAKRSVIRVPQYYDNKKELGVIQEKEKPKYALFGLIRGWRIEILPPKNIYTPTGPYSKPKTDK